MARKSWFDEQSNEPLFSKYVEQMESWQHALADGMLQPEEVKRQAARVADMLHALEPKPSDKVHEELTNIFYELAVLYGMQRLVDMGFVEGGEG